jgi:hypothetical protein
MGLVLLLLGERLLGLKLWSLTESLLRLAEIHIYESRLGFEMVRSEMLKG